KSRQCSRLTQSCGNSPQFERRGGNQRFVDRGRRFGLNKRRTMRGFSAQAALASEWTQDAPKAIDRIAAHRGRMAMLDFVQQLVSGIIPRCAAILSIA